jgi:hypothetical protein
MFDSLDPLVTRVQYGNEQQRVKYIPKLASMEVTVVCVVFLPYYVGSWLPRTA